MNRRAFLQTGTAGVATGLAPAARAYISEHNWEKYDWGSGPEVKDRLYQGPFPQYPPAAVVPDSDVVMVTTPSKDIVPNYGMGLVVYVCGDTGPPRLPGETLEKSLEDLVKIPFTQKISGRGKPSWQQASRRIFARSSPNGRRGEPSLFPCPQKFTFWGTTLPAEGDILGQVRAGPLADAPRPFSSCSPAAPRRKMRAAVNAEAFQRRAQDAGFILSTPHNDRFSVLVNETWARATPQEILARLV